jgi:hypothetical protein
LSTPISSAVSPSSEAAREDLEQAVLDHDREAERHEDGGQDAASQQAVQQEPLKRVADHGHHRHHHAEREQRIEAELLDAHDGEEGGQDAEVAVREVHQPHHAEDQREPGGEERVEAAEQDALHDAVEPRHRSASEVRGGNPLAREPPGLAFDGHRTRAK